MRVTWGTIVGLPGLAGCFLPIATGTPQPATTVGEGRFGGAMAAEMPAVNLIADDPDEISPAAAGTFTLAYGLTDHTDVELSLEGALYLFLLPLPTGASLGLRHNLVDGDGLALGLAARAGAVGVSDGDPEDPDKASSVYGAASLAMELGNGRVRPLLALQGMGARITQELGDADDGTFGGFIGSATLALPFRVGRGAVLGPYVAASWLSTDRLVDQTLVSFGVTVAIRPERPRAVIAAPVPGPAGGPPGTAPSY
ncbi:MAG: hypothetical protein R2939_00950 [Kofleriaceae bacterium]